MTAAEQTLARVRKILPEAWDRSTEPNAAARLDEVRRVLYRQAPVRSRIVRYVGQFGAARMSEIRDALELPSGACSGHLTALVGQGKLTRAARGVYTLPGTDPDAAIVMAGLPPAARRGALLARGDQRQ